MARRSQLQPTPQRSESVEKPDRIADLAREIFISRVASNPGRTPEQHARTSFADAKAFFVVADEQQTTKPKAEK